ncbi:MAG: hypothetical protein ACT4QE_24545 [Anaerolineales bacterium]
MLASLIGAMATVIATALSSPFIMTLLTRPPTATVEAIAVTAVAPAMLAPVVQAIESTAVTPPPLPTLLPNTLEPAASSLFECLDSQFWTPYPPNLQPTASNNCWELAEWGLKTQDGQLHMDYVPSLDQQRGIYRSIPTDGMVRFTIQMDRLQVRSNKTALLTFGVIRRDPVSIYTGGFLSYSQSSPGVSAIQMSVSGDQQATQRLAPIDFGTKQDVVLTIQTGRLTVSLNGQLVGDPVKLPSGERALWIGYVLPAHSKLQAVISDFALQP